MRRWQVYQKKFSSISAMVLMDSCPGLINTRSVFATTVPCGEISQYPGRRPWGLKKVRPEVVNQKNAQLAVKLSSFSCELKLLRAFTD